MGEKVKFAVIGYGRMGKKHVSVIDDHPDCELAAIVDTHAQQGLPGIPFYNDLDRFLESSAVAETDVVVIATPNGLHAPHALKCLNAKKHVLIEKPMALNSTDAAAIIKKATEVQRQVFVMMQNRFSPVSVWLKELADSGVLGNIYLVQVNCFWNRDERYYKKGSWHGTKDLDGGALFTQFSHFVDLLYWCFGDITNISSNFRNFGHEGMIDFEDTGIAHFDFVKGGVGCLSYTTATWDKNLESSFTVIAENGSLKVSGQYMDRVEYCHIKGYPEPVNKEITEYSGNHQYFIQNLLCCLGDEDFARPDIDDGLQVIDIIERIYSTIDG